MRQGRVVASRAACGTDSEVKPGPLLLFALAASCGGALEVEEPSAPPPRPVVIHGRLIGEVGDCGISGYKTCYTDPVALEVWLLPRPDSTFCPTATDPNARCSPRERRPLAQVIASDAGEFKVETTEGDYQLAVIYKDSLRPLISDEAHGRGTFDGGFHLSSDTFRPDEVFWFPGDPPRYCTWVNPKQPNDFVICPARTTCQAFDTCNTCMCLADLSRSCTTRACP